MGSRNIDIDQHREAREFSMHPRQFVIKSIIHRIRCSPPQQDYRLKKLYGRLQGLPDDLFARYWWFGMCNTDPRGGSSFMLLYSLLVAVISSSFLDLTTRFGRNGWQEHRLEFFIGHMNDQADGTIVFLVTWRQFAFPPGDRLRFLWCWGAFCSRGDPMFRRHWGPKSVVISIHAEHVSPERPLSAADTLGGALFPNFHGAEVAPSSVFSAMLLLRLPVSIFGVSIRALSSGSQFVPSLSCDDDLIWQHLTLDEQKIGIRRHDYSGWYRLKRWGGVHEGRKNPGASWLKLTGSADRSNIRGERKWKSMCDWSSTQQHSSGHLPRNSERPPSFTIYYIWMSLLVQKERESERGREGDFMCIGSFALECREVWEF